MNTGFSLITWIYIPLTPSPPFYFLNLPLTTSETLLAAPAPGSEKQQAASAGGCKARGPSATALVTEAVPSSAERKGLSR